MWNPEADAGEWAEYVAEWTEEGKTDALQEYVGYCLEVGAMPIHRAVLLVGSGANGKGTFLKVVRQLLGEENTPSFVLRPWWEGRHSPASLLSVIGDGS